MVRVVRASNFQVKSVDFSLIKERELTGIHEEQSCSDLGPNFEGETPCPGSTVQSYLV